MYRITVIIQTRRVGVYTVDNYSKNKNKKGRSIYSIHRSGGEVTLQGKKKGGGGTAVGRSLRSDNTGDRRGGVVRVAVGTVGFPGGRGG